MYDTLIVDTAGRLHIDEEMMQQIQGVCSAVTPTEVLLVVDAMTGQDAVNIAKSFDETVPLTGIVLTKLDGDARGGAALSMRAVTGKPIKFAGIRGKDRKHRDVSSGTHGVAYFGHGRCADAD